MTVQSTFITTENVQGWYLIEHDSRLSNGIMWHPLIAWKIRGIDAPAIPITVSGGPRIITRETDWFMYHRDSQNFYGMYESGCWYKHHLDDSSQIPSILKDALKTRRAVTVTIT